MRTKYLLPCSCGKKVAVEDTQSGQQIRCECGAELQVPTMQRLHHLEQIVPEEPPESTRAGWNPLWGIVLLGAVIAIGGGLMTYSTYRQRPQLFDMDQLTPLETFLMWQNLRTGVRLPELAEVPYLEAKRVYHQHLGIALTIMSLGGLITLVSAIAAGRAGSRAARRRQ